MFQKLEDVERRYVDLETSLVDPAVIGNRKDYARLSKERSDLDEIVQRYRGAGRRQPVSGGDGLS